MNTTGKTGLRQSNFELLRIISIFMIVLHHFYVHIDWPVGQSVDKDIAIALLGFGGKVGVDCFVLITGYFQSQSRFKIRSLVKIWVEVLTYSFAILVLVYFANPSLITQKLFVRSVFPVLAGLNWFVPAYFGLYCLSPIFNLCINRLSRRQYNYLLSVGFLALSLAPFFLDENPLESDLVWLSYVYFVGAYIRKYGQDKLASFKLNPCRYACGGPWVTLFSTAILILISIPIITLLNLNYGLDIYQLYFADSTSPFGLLLAASLFVIFSRISFCSRAINAIASASIAVYLISDNPMLRKCLNSFVWVYDMPLPNLLITAVGICAAIFIACVAIELIRVATFQWLFVLLERRFGGCFDLVDRSFSSMK